MKMRASPQRLRKPKCTSPGLQFAFDYYAHGCVAQHGVSQHVEEPLATVLRRRVHAPQHPEIFGFAILLEAVTWDGFRVEATTDRPRGSVEDSRELVVAFNLQSLHQ